MVEVHIQHIESIHQEVVLQITGNKIKMEERHNQVKKAKPIKYEPGGYVWYKTMRQDKVWQYKGW